MSKNKEPTNQEIPIDYQVEIKNLQYTIVLREQEIAAIKETLVKNGAYIKKLESDIFDAKKQIVYYYDIEKKVGKLRHSNELLKKDIENLNQEILNQKAQYLEEKKQAEKSFNVKINQLQNIIENSNQKLEMTNKITEENKQLKKLLEEIKKESSEIKRKSDKDLVDLAIKNKLKFSILKKKMMENIKNSQIKVTELNMQYMDVSSKLTLLQNHQLLTQLDYLQEQIDEYTAVNEQLKKKNKNLLRDIEIHKEVEVSLAEKNRKLKNELIKQKECKEEKEEEKNNDKDKEKEEDNNKEDTKKNENIEKKKYNINPQVINLEQKIINLEEKLKHQKFDFNYLKDKYDFIENYLKNYEKKFLRIINFLQDCLNKFYIDEDLLSNKDVNIHIDDIKKGDFSSLSKEEQYSILIILMKYLMPMVNQAKLNNEVKKVNKINLRFHLPEIKTNIPFELKNHKKLKFKKPHLNIRSMSAENLLYSIKDSSLPSFQSNSGKHGPVKVFGNFSNKYQGKYKNSSQSINTGISTGN